jgi:hypothetical protein
VLSTRYHPASFSFRKKKLSRFYQTLVCNGTYRFTLTQIVLSEKLLMRDTPTVIFTGSHQPPALWKNYFNLQDSIIAFVSNHHYFFIYSFINHSLGLKSILAKYFFYVNTYFINIRNIYNFSYNYLIFTYTFFCIFLLSSNLNINCY